MSHQSAGPLVGATLSGGPKPRRCPPSLGSAHPAFDRFGRFLVEPGGFGGRSAPRRDAQYADIGDGVSAMDTEHLADGHFACGFDPLTPDPDSAAPNGARGEIARLEESCVPQPAINPHGPSPRSFAGPLTYSKNASQDED